MAVKYLDHYAPGWSCEIKDVSTSGTRCIVTVRISVVCLEGIISREATGTEDEELMRAQVEDTSSAGDRESWLWLVFARQSLE